MSRKLLSLLVAVAFVLTTVSTGFAAAVPTDVSSDYVKAVSKLQALNIMAGYPDGTFKPDQTITRAEFAKIAVVAMGLKDAAVISAGSTSFKDVAADHWASGFINVAASQGIITGYPDGTFKPDQTINYAEALTILGKMLGYGPVLAGKPWPAAYVGKAADIGVTSGVVLAPTVGASRGNVAKLMSNTLDTKVVYVDSYDDTGKPVYKVGGDDNYTLMAKKLNIIPVVDTNNNKTFEVTMTPMVKNSPTVDDSTLKNTDSGLVQTRGFVDGLNPNDYLGLDVKFWKNSDGKIVTSEVQNAAGDIYNGLVQRDDTKIKLIDKGVSYDQSSDFVGYVNSSPVASLSEIYTKIADPDYGFGTVILKDGRIRFANIYVENNQAQSGMTVRTFEVKSVSDGYIKAQGAVVSDFKIQDIKDNATKKIVRYDIIKNGKAATIDDIAVGDIVTRIGNHDVNSATTYERWYVTTNVVKGTLTAVSGTDATMTLTIGGKDYKYANVATNVWTLNNGDNFYAPNSSNALVKDIVGKDVTVKLNAAGRIASLWATASSTTYYYGIVRNFAANVGANLDNAVTLYKPDGTKVSYVFDKIADIANVSSTSGAAEVKFNTTGSGIFDRVSKGDLVEYQLTSDGKIKEGTLILANRANNGATSWEGTGVSETLAAGLVKNNYVPFTGNGAIVTASSAMFNTYDLVNTNGDAQVISFSTIDGIGTTYTAVVKDGVVKALSVSSNSITAGTSGVVVGTGYDADGKTVTINVAGTVKTYKQGSLSDVWFSTAMAAGLYVDFKVGSDGKLSDITSNTNINNTTTGLTTYKSVSTFAAGNTHIFRVLNIDTTNKVLKLNHINISTKMEDGLGDIYLRYDTANLDVYDVKGKGDSPVVIKGGLNISNLSQYDYVWLGGAGGAANAYDFSKLLILKVDDIKSQS